MLAVCLFGRPRFSIDGAPWDFRANRKTIPLLGYLLARPEAPIGREYLATLLWPDEPEDIGRANLRRYLHLISRALPPATPDVPFILNTQHTTRWNPLASSTVDIAEFTAASAGERDLDRATELYTGPFLEEFYDDWIVAERERLLETQLENLQKLVRRKRGERDFAGALADVERILALDPWREDAIRTALKLRDEMGDRSGAISAYRTFAERLRADLETEPMPETRAAYEALLRDAPAERIVLAKPDAASSPQTRALPFCGRSTELAHLMRAWMTAASGAGTFVLVGGEAGIGKSRLVAELSLTLEAQGARVFAGATSAYESQPHEAIADCLRGAATLLETCALPQRTLGALARLVPSFGSTADATAAHEPAATPQADRFALFEAVADAFAALARTRPLLVVLEDLHWAGSATFSLLEFLAYRLADRPIALVATYRSEEIDRAHALRTFRRGLERGTSLTHIPLERFDRGTIATIARELSGGESDDFERVVDRLYAQSEGVPLFLDAAFRDDPSDHGTVDRLRIDARLARLAPEALTVLEVAAIVGSGFDVEIVRETLGWSEAEVVIAIDRLIAAYLVREPRGFRRSDFAFTHHLVQQAVYERIDENLRRRRHGAIARALVELYGATASGDSATIAFHWERAGLAGEAASAYAVAARRAMELYASDEARGFASRAIALASDDRLRCEMYLLRARAAERSADHAAQQADLEALASFVVGTPYEADYQLARTRIALKRAEFREAEDFLSRARRAASESDARVLFEAGVLEANLLYQRGAFSEARTILDRVIAECERQGDDAGLLTALESLLTMATASLDLALVSAYGEPMLARAERVGDVDRQAFAHDRMGVALQRTGQIERALTHLETARGLYERVRNVPSATMTGYNIATVHIMLGRYEVAQTLFEAGIAEFRELQNHTAIAALHSNLAATAILLGDADRAAEIARRGIAEMGDTRNGVYAQLKIALASAHWMLGAFADAAAIAREAADIIRPYGASEPLAEALLMCLLTALERDDLPAARSHYAELASVPAEVRNHALFPETYPWIFARLAEREGDATAAAAWRSEAVDLFAAHLERLAPEGVAPYRRLRFIAPIAEYAERAPFRTPGGRRERTLNL